MGPLAVARPKKIKVGGGRGAYRDKHDRVLRISGSVCTAVQTEERSCGQGNEVTPTSVTFMLERQRITKGFSKNIETESITRRIGQARVK